MICVIGLLPDTHEYCFVQWAKERAGITRMFVIVESDIFIRFNLRRQV
jgi:hypothetical protein